ATNRRGGLRALRVAVGPTRPAMARHMHASARSAFRKWLIMPDRPGFALDPWRLHAKDRSAASGRETAGVEVRRAHPNHFYTIKKLKEKASEAPRVHYAARQRAGDVAARAQPAMGSDMCTADHLRRSHILWRYSASR